MTRFYGGRRKDIEAKEGGNPLRERQIGLFAESGLVKIGFGPRTGSSRTGSWLSQMWKTKRNCIRLQERKLANEKFLFKR